MSDSVRLHRQQPTRLPRPWDSPGKNTGVGCHFLLQCMKVKSESEVAQLCPTSATPWTAAYQAPPSMGFSRQEYWSGVPLPPPQNILWRSKLALVSSMTSMLSVSKILPPAWPYQSRFLGEISITSDIQMTGEGNGTQLQYSCLENPMDGGAW